jgi:hypothetical protein
MPARAMGRSLSDMVRYLTAAVLAGALCCGCGGGGEVASSQPSETAASCSGPATPARGHISTARLASCLRAAGATVVTQPGQADEGAPWQEEGEIEADFGAVDLFLGVMTTERGARYHLAAGVGLAGGGPTLDGDPIQDHLGRVRNVSVLFSDAPSAATRKAVEDCLGGPLRFDPPKI